MEQHAGGPAADQALLMLGNLYSDLGRTSEARAAFQKRLDQYGESGPEGYAAKAGLATALEDMGNLAEAAAEYRSYAERHPDSPFAPISLEEAGRCYRIAGDTAKAAEVYRSIVEKHPQSSARQVAEEQLGLMGQSK